MKKNYYYFYLISINVGILIFFILDRWIKELVFGKDFDFLVYTNSFFEFEFTYLLNQAVAFGIPFPKYVILFFIFSILSIILFLLFRSYKEKNLFYSIVLSMILIGAISNLIDRLVFGGVIDYLSLSFYSIQFPVFNISDVMIVVGTLMWVYLDMKKRRDLKNYFL